MPRAATMVCLVAGCLAVFFAVGGVVIAETPLERGSYLVNAVMASNGRTGPTRSSPSPSR